MTNILTALEKLNQSLGHLEMACESQEKKMQDVMDQQDLFGEGTALNPALIAQKLDTAIERVETVLREG